MKKRLITAILVLAMCLSILAGCGASAPEENTPTTPAANAGTTPVGQEEPKQIENIVWARYGLYQNDDYETAQKEVEAALNAYLAENYGITVTMKCFSMAEYNEQMPLELAAGADIDVMCAGTGIPGVDPKVVVPQGMALDITDLVKTVTPKLYESISEEIWSTVSFGGRYYHLPIGKDLTYGWGYVVNDTFVDRYGWDLSVIEKYEDWEPFLEEMKDDEDCAFAFWPYNYINMMMDEHSGITDYAGVAIDGDWKTIEFLPDTPEFMEWAKLMKKWADAGYWPEDMMVNQKNYKQMRNAGQYGSYLVFPYATNEYTYEAMWGVPCTQVVMTELWMGDGLGSGYIINANTEHAEACMKFLEALMLDPVVGDLAAFGVEGKHYTREADGRVTKIPNSGYEVDSWSVTDIFNISVQSNEPADKLELTKEFIDKNVLSPTTGFVFDASNVSAEYAACNEVVSSYNELFIFGMVDPEVEIPKYSKALKDAGVEKVIAEMQAQFEAFLASK